MQPLSWARVLLAGLAAGVVINSIAYIFAIEYILDGSVFAKPWVEAIPALNQPSFTPTNFMAIQQVWGFLAGVLAVWLYARTRAREKSASPWVPALIAWAVTSLIACAALLALKIPLSALAIVAGLFEVAMGTLLGSWIYREAEAAFEQTVGATLVE